MYVRDLEFKKGDRVVYNDNDDPRNHYNGRRATVKKDLVPGEALIEIVFDGEEKLISPFTAYLSNLKKLYNIGDKVKITRGVYANWKGVLINIDHNDPFGPYTIRLHDGISQSNELVMKESDFVLDSKVESRGVKLQQEEPKKDNKMEVVLVKKNEGFENSWIDDDGNIWFKYNHQDLINEIRDCLEVEDFMGAKDYLLSLEASLAHTKKV